MRKQRQKKKPRSIRTNEESMKLPIEKHIPIPERALIEYPFDEMKIGDSFVAPASGVSEQYLVKGKLEHLTSKITGKQFHCGFCEGGIRCWRIK